MASTSEPRRAPMREPSTPAPSRASSSCRATTTTSSSATAATSPSTATSAASTSRPAIASPPASPSAASIPTSKTATRPCSTSSSGVKSASSTPSCGWINPRNGRRRLNSTSIGAFCFSEGGYRLRHYASCDTKRLRRSEMSFHATRNGSDGRKCHFMRHETAQKTSSGHQK